MSARYLLVAMFLVLATPATAAEIAQPPIVTRADWGAAKANHALMRPQTPQGIILHHTGVRQKPGTSLEKKLRGLQSFSMNPGKVAGTGKKKPGWGDMPYHFYIDVTGRIGEGRDPAFAGDTNTGYKTDGFIQVVVEGEFGAEKPDPRQLRALDALMAWLAASWKVPGSRITAHDDHAKSECPGKNLKPHLTHLRDLADAVLK